MGEPRFRCFSPGDGAKSELTGNLQTLAIERSFRLWLGDFLARVRGQKRAVRSWHTPPGFLSRDESPRSWHQEVTETGYRQVQMSCADPTSTSLQDIAARPVVQCGSLPCAHLLTCPPTLYQQCMTRELEALSLPTVSAAPTMMSAALRCSNQPEAGQEPDHRCGRPFAAIYQLAIRDRKYPRVLAPIPSSACNTNIYIHLIEASGRMPTPLGGRARPFGC